MSRLLRTGLRDLQHTEDRLSTPRLEIEPRSVTVTDVVHRYKDTAAVDGVSLKVEAGEFLTLLGPSGSGKTTLLRIIAGLIAPSDGTVKLGDRDVTHVAPQHRDMGMVFQNYSLFPHMSVSSNVAYPLAIRRIPRKERHERVQAALERVNLPDIGDRPPSALSGGQQQRVAVARALVYEPSVLLMDEPLGALDRKLRRHMQSELRQLQQQLGITCIFVTHDQEEALTMSDRIGVMNSGKLLQLDTPARLYREPLNHFVANFLGDTNSFEGVLERTQHGVPVLRLDSQTCIAVPTAEAAVGSHVSIGVRPEHVSVSTSAAAGANSVRVRLEEAVFAGPSILLKGRTDGGQLIASQLPSIDASDLEPGAVVYFGWKPEHQMVQAQHE